MGTSVYLAGSRPRYRSVQGTCIYARWVNSSESRIGRALWGNDGAPPTLGHPDAVDLQEIEGWYPKARKMSATVVVVPSSRLPLMLSSQKVAGSLGGRM